MAEIQPVRKTPDRITPVPKIPTPDLDPRRRQPFPKKPEKNIPKPDDPGTPVSEPDDPGTYGPDGKPVKPPAPSKIDISK